MRALVVKEFGGPLILEDVPIPQPATDEVLIRVKACAVDQFDLTIRDGKFAMAKKVPIILGHEIAGVVEASFCQSDCHAFMDLISGHGTAGLVQALPIRGRHPG